MNPRIQDMRDEYPKLEFLVPDIIHAYEIIRDCYYNHGKLLICGNGGSCADSEHIVGELMKGHQKKRPISEEMKEKMESVSQDRGTILAGKMEGGLPAIALDSHISLNSAFINDVADGGTFYYAQSVMVYGNKEDVFLGISTSGNAENVIYAAIAAKAKGMKVIALSGRDGGELMKYADCAILAPGDATHRIQESHMAIYHTLCLMIEDEFFKD